MQYADVGGHRQEAFPGGRGQCPGCGAEVVAKCGRRIIHHWAHAGRRDCDPWWENETDWHRAWKGLFPPECREVHHVALDGEVHRADIRTPTGIVVEVQHSAMTDAERQAREAFYENLVWIIDGRPFRDRFDIFHMLPSPRTALAADLVWSKATREMQGAARGQFFRLSEVRWREPDLVVTKASLGPGLRLMHGLDSVRAEVERAYEGHHQYGWIRPHRTWLDATCPVYIDLGEDHLARLETYDETGLPCVRLVAKDQFVHDAMTEARATDIADQSRFKPCSCRLPAA